MESGGFPGLQNQCDLTVSGRVGSIPIHSRQFLLIRKAILTVSLFRNCATPFALRALFVALLAPAAAAQRPDSTRVRAMPARAPIPDSLKPPISPRRAFLYSAILPGSGQAILGRNKAAAAMLAVEA